MLVLLPVVRQTAETYYEETLEEIQADRMGQDRESIEFQNNHLWYTRKELIEHSTTLIDLTQIVKAYPSWEKDWTILFCREEPQTVKSWVVRIPFAEFCAKLETYRQIDKIFMQ